MCWFCCKCMNKKHYYLCHFPSRFESVQRNWYFENCQRMAVGLERVTRIHQIRQLTVYGYIREQERTNNVEITKRIILLCILFFAKDFIDDLIDLTYGGEEQWIDEQKQIKEYFIGHTLDDIKQMKKIEFSRRIESMTMYPKAQSGRLFGNLRKERHPNINILSIDEIIITEISTYRDERRKRIHYACTKANIDTNNSSTTPQETYQILTTTFKLKKSKADNVMIKLFGFSIDTQLK